MPTPEDIEKARQRIAAGNGLIQAAVRTATLSREVLRAGTTPPGVVSFNLNPDALNTANTNFLQEGDKVIALVEVYDLPNQANNLHCASPGDTGIVVHAQEGHWPTVRFERTGYSTCVTDREVEKV